MQNESGSALSYDAMSSPGEQQLIVFRKLTKDTAAPKSSMVRKRYGYRQLAHLLEAELKTVSEYKTKLMIDSVAK